MNYNQPYFGNGMVQPGYLAYPQMYQNNNQGMQQQMPQIAQMPKMPITDIFPKLQGKSVDSIDVVKAMDIPLDGTISYFPLTDGSAIVTKQLQQDGTSKTIVYKPSEQETPTELPTYITAEELDDAIKKIDISREVKEELKNMKRNIDDMADDLKDLSKKVK